MEPSKEEIEKALAFFREQLLNNLRIALKIGMPELYPVIYLVRFFRKEDGLLHTAPIAFGLPEFRKAMGIEPSALSPEELTLALGDITHRLSTIINPDARLLFDFGYLPSSKANGKKDSGFFCMEQLRNAPLTMFEIPCKVVNEKPCELGEWAQVSEADMQRMARDIKSIRVNSPGAGAVMN